MHKKMEYVVHERFSLIQCCVRFKSTSAEILKTILTPFCTQNIRNLHTTKLNKNSSDIF